METGIHIGASRASAEKIVETVMAILDAHCDEETKRTALETISRVMRVENSSVSSCNFDSGDKLHVDFAGLAEAIRELKAPKLQKRPAKLRKAKSP